MIKKNKSTPKQIPPTTEDCKIHVMPSIITDEDITALFNGLVQIVKQKIKLETEEEFLNINQNYNRLKQELKSKQAECNRLKNEILFLKSKIKE